MCAQTVAPMAAPVKGMTRVHMILLDHLLTIINDQIARPAMPMAKQTQAIKRRLLITITKLHNIMVDLPTHKLKLDAAVSTARVTN